MKSPQLRTYQKEFETLGPVIISSLKEQIADLRRLVDSGAVLVVSRKFKIARSSVLRKDGHPKRYDITNRVKALDDCICKMIDIDDKYIFHSHSEKIVADITESFVDVKIEAREM